jgi:RNA polymerase sigma-70 factor (ECF subfamily)
MSEELRPLMFALAYRMVGTVSDAEDLVQEAHLRMHQALAAGTSVDSPRAYLTTVVTRLAIDHLRCARVRRETYPGPWMPEPIVERVDEAPAESAELTESLSIAYLVLLDRLSATERAVLLLHDVFGYPFDEIAAIVDRSEPGCRQIAVRARRRLDAERPRFDRDLHARTKTAEAFLAAFRDGDIDALLHLVAEDVVFVGDGGGRAAALPQPVHGRDRVGHLLRAFAHQNRRLNLYFEPAWVNGQPGAVVRDLDGFVVTVIALDILGGAVRTVRSIVNPDKISHLGAVSPLTRRRDRPDNG